MGVSELKELRQLRDLKARDDLAASPFRKEGHRKVYYRLKHVQQVRVAPKRILVWSSTSTRNAWASTHPSLRTALADFAALHNRAWRLENRGGRTPDEARRAWVTGQAA